MSIMCMQLFMLKGNVTFIAILTILSQRIVLPNDAHEHWDNQLTAVASAF